MSFSIRPLFWLLVLVAAAIQLSGCAVDGQLQNRVSTTLGCDQALYTSMYGPIGITSKIDGRDLAQMPCAARDKAAAPAAPASAAK